MGRPIPTFLKFSQNTGAAPPNTDNYYIMPEHSFVTMKTAVVVCIQHMMTILYVCIKLYLCGQIQIIRACSFN